MTSARRQRPEAAIHAAVCDHLHLRAKPDVLWLHPANGGTRDIREAARNFKPSIATAWTPEEVDALAELWSKVHGNG